MDNDKNAAMPDREKVKTDAAEVVEKSAECGEAKDGDRQDDGSRRGGIGIAWRDEQASKQLKENELGTLATLNQIGSSIKSFSDQLRNRNVDDILSDVQKIARRNPTRVFPGQHCGWLCGIEILKASADRDNEHYETHSGDQPESYTGETGFACADDDSESHEL